MIKASIIADSINPNKQRLTSFVLRFPRFILAEINTHRAFSRNSASSRAIPFPTMFKQVMDDPFIPIAWQKDHSGMQGTEYFQGMTIQNCINGWLKARNFAVKSAEAFEYIDFDSTIGKNTGLTKQLANRLLEPFMWHTAIVSATDWDNFFKLRCPRYEHTKNILMGYDKEYSYSKKDWLHYETLGLEGTDFKTDLEWLNINKGQGEIHIMALAEAMWDALNESKPKVLEAGEWHIPFGDSFDKDRLQEYVWKQSGIIGNTPIDSLKIKIATARCARVSYLNYEGKDNYEADITLYDRLLESGHMSPFEHCAIAQADNNYYGNFCGWKQKRQFIEQESK